MADPAEHHTILIVEDDWGYRRALADRLRHEGFICIEAENGEEGLELAEAHKPSLIILDVVLPGILGDELLHEIRKSPVTHDIHVMMLTVLEETLALQECMRAGANEYVLKDVTPLETIVSKIAAVLFSAESIRPEFALVKKIN